MTKTPAVPRPEIYGLTSFVDLLPAREPIIGEDPGVFDAFRQAMIVTLAPTTPYEHLIAENLIAIEWELLQHRRMRDAHIRQLMRGAIREAVVKQQRSIHQAAELEDMVAQARSGKSAEEWDWISEFDYEEAKEIGNDLAERATSREPKIQSKAVKEITKLGLKPVELMSEACASSSSMLICHEERLQDLERRRREVKRDFDALQKLRPIEARAIEPEVIDA